MTLASSVAVSTDPYTAEAQGTHVDAPELRLFVIFIFDGITSLNDVLIPKFKELFTLDYAHAMAS
ncbi:hypothetical protein [Sphingobium sp. 3R8]|uniref:hypothetical protein n=1 Tax=Sphingobium sp. 3R8 TaxID=2874921 RepID=UPI00398CEB38